jgi:hypothetical protein
VGQGRSKSIPNVAGIFDPDALRTHGLGDLSEIAGSQRASQAQSFVSEPGKNSERTGR